MKFRSLRPTMSFKAPCTIHYLRRVSLRLVSSYPLPLTVVLGIFDRITRLQRRTAAVGASSANSKKCRLSDIRHEFDDAAPPQARSEPIA